ncbi:unnamed protein product [Dovyalis caffra]|uniref:K-box domain-containing protein n=1 Tax=Dovyalis caffra TaxID=77055 RepID=A0AAV1RK84_9ROSI|nr:unnamed protein product [Dovyalis caffra]
MATSSKVANNAEVTAKHLPFPKQVHYGKYANLNSYAELLQKVQRNLEAPCSGELILSDLVQLETQLRAALTHVRARKLRLGCLRPTYEGKGKGLKAKSVHQSLHDQVQYACVQFNVNEEKMLKEENQLLEKQIVAMKNSGETYYNRMTGCLQLILHDKQHCICLNSKAALHVV